MAVGSASKRSTDPFWDKVIAAHETVAMYPDQTIEVEVLDKHARIWYNGKNDVIWVRTWTAPETEGVKDNA